MNIRLSSPLLLAALIACPVLVFTTGDASGAPCQNTCAVQSMSNTSRNCCEQTSLVVCTYHFQKRYTPVSGCSECTQCWKTITTSTAIECIDGSCY